MSLVVRKFNVDRVVEFCALWQQAILPKYLKKFCSKFIVEVSEVYNAL